MTRATPTDYELLGVGPGVTSEELKHAWETLSELLAPGVLPLYSLVEPEEQPALLERLRAAYEAVAADLGSGEAAAASPAARPAPGGGPRQEQERPSLPAVITGQALRVIREQRGVALRTIADRTRIGLRQLEDIEAEAFSSFPVEVYLRGFVMAYARALRLDPDAVWRGYRERWRSATSG
ncbi:MAG: helix-turn-helix domain-containing protein [Acidobacteriota bacterium]